MIKEKFDIITGLKVRTKYMHLPLRTGTPCVPEQQQGTLIVEQF
jgi:hypothetical protein